MMKVFNLMMVAISFFLATNSALAVTMSCSVDGSDLNYTFSLDENNSCKLISIPQNTGDWISTTPRCVANSKEVVINSSSQFEHSRLNDWHKHEVNITIDRSNGILARKSWLYFSSEGKGAPNTSSGKCKKIIADQF